MNELSISRFIAAPPDRVWQAMTDRQDEWWCPLPWRNETKLLERRAGGRWLGVMNGPGGEEVTNDAVILAWDEGKRFVSTDAVRIVDGEYMPATNFMVGTWQIEPATQDGVEGTLYSASARHWSEETCKQHEQMGFVEGWQACAAQLAALCED